MKKNSSSIAIEIDSITQNENCQMDDITTIEIIIATKSISTTKGEASQATGSITQNEYCHADCGLSIPFPNNLPEQRGEYCLSREEY